MPVLVFSCLCADCYARINAAAFIIEAQKALYKSHILRNRHSYQSKCSHLWGGRWLLFNRWQGCYHSWVFLSFLGEIRRAMGSNVFLCIDRQGSLVKSDIFY